MALLSEALLNRGFLVEKQRSTILLTSEMVLPGDARVLQTCLRRMGLDSALAPWPVDTLPFRLLMPDQPLIQPIWMHCLKVGMSSRTSSFRLASGSIASGETGFAPGYRLRRLILE